MSVPLDTILENVLLAPFTTWDIGGPARSLFCPASKESLSAHLATFSSALPLFWLGLGSNILVPDAGMAVHVILTHKGLTQLKILDEERIYAEAGVPCAKLARKAAAAHWHDAAFFAGIPGTVGGALAMNAGAWGGETWRFVESVETIDRQGVVRTRSPTDFHIGYRTVVPTALEKEWFIGAVFRFAPYPLVDTMAHIRTLLQQRAVTQPIGTRNCGSVFRNPPGEAAGKLIESVGLKGEILGDIMVSPKHANFIINSGKGTATEVITLMRLARQRVWQMHGVILVPEVKLLGALESLWQETPF